MLILKFIAAATLVLAVYAGAYLHGYYDGYADGNRASDAFMRSVRESLRSNAE